MQKSKLTLSLVKEFKVDYRNVIPRLIKEHGDKFVLSNFFQNIHIFTDPAYLEHVLFKQYTNYIRPPNPMFDPVINSSVLTPLEILERWRKFRSTLLNPTMSINAVKEYSNVMAKETLNHMHAVWDGYAASREDFAIYPDLERMTLKNLIKTELYDVPLDIEHVTKLIDEVAFLAISYEMALSKLAWKLPTRMRRHSREVVKELISVSDQVINHCISPDRPNTIFKDAIRAYGKNPEDPNLKNDSELWSFLRAIAGGYITGGFDTLSRSLSVTIAYLSLFPEVADTMREEYKQKIGDGEITPDNVESLVYTRAVFHEGLRYSGGVVPIITRLSLGNDQIGDYVVKKGDRVMLPLFYMGLSPSYWKDPEVFNPSRFLNLNMMDPQFRYIYVPFSAGIRGCSGRNFAALEATVILALLVKNYKLDLISDRKINSDDPAKIRFKVNKIT